MLTVQRKPSEPGLFQACFSGLADRFSSSLVLVVWSHISHALVQPDGVVVAADHGELGTQGRRVGDREQVGVLDLDVSVQGLDPGLVGRGAGPAEMLGDSIGTYSLRSGLSTKTGS